MSTCPCCDQQMSSYCRDEGDPPGSRLSGSIESCMFCGYTDENSFIPDDEFQDEDLETSEEEICDLFMKLTPEGQRRCLDSLQAMLYPDSAHPPSGQGSYSHLIFPE
jgi:hypothetical protein